MRLLRHVIAKDLRRSRWLLLVAALLAALRAWLVVSPQQLPTINPAASFVHSGLSLLVPFTEIVFFWLFVSLIVHEEPLVGSSAFWLTRPIDRRALLIAKLLTISAVLVGIPVVVNTVLLAVWSAPVSSIVTADLQLALIRTAWLAVAFIVASLTPSTVAYTLATIGALVALGAGSVITLTLLSVLNQSRGIVRGSLPEPPVPDDTGWIALYLGIALMGLGVVAFQYSTRRQWVTLAMGALVLTASVFWLPRVPWRFARANEPTPPTWATTMSPRLSGLEVRTDPSLDFTRGDTRYLISARVELPALPRGYSVQTFALESRLLPESGPPVTGRTSRSILSFKSEDLRPAVTWYGLLDDTPLSNPWNSLTEHAWPVLMATSSADHSRLASSVLGYEGLVDLRVTAHRVAGVLAVIDGVSVRTDSYLLEIQGVFWGPNGCTLLLRESHFPRLRPGERPKLTVVLRNVARGSSILGAIHGEPAPLPVSAFAVFLPAAALTRPSAFSWVAKWNASFLSSSGSGSIARPLTLDDAWLKGAEVVVIESRYAGRVIRPSSAQGLRFSSVETLR